MFLLLIFSYYCGQVGTRQLMNFSLTFQVRLKMLSRRQKGTAKNTCYNLFLNKTFKSKITLSQGAKRLSRENFKSPTTLNRLSHQVTQKRNESEK